MHISEKAKHTYSNIGPLRFVGAVIRRIGNKTHKSSTFVDEHLQSNADVDIGTQIRMLRKGFTKESVALFDLGRNDPSNYMSNYFHIFKGYNVNDGAVDFTKNKSVFHRAMAEFDTVVPELLGECFAGEVYVKGEERGRVSDWLAEYVPEDEPVVLKPNGGSGGSGIYVVSWSDTGFSLNGKGYTEDDLKAELESLDRYVITEFVEQAEYSEKIHGGSANTMRIHTLIDPKNGEPFIAAAAHRFGTRSSGPVDNLAQGGVVADIDIDQGCLGDVAIVSGFEKSITDKHPDTGAQITGIEIENWERIQGELLEIANHLRFMPYIGWDVVATDDSFKILEGNARPGIKVSQLHGGMFEDGRTQDFFDQY